MKLSPSQIQQALTQFEAQVIPEDHPQVMELKELFGDHTFFLASNGSNVVELSENIQAGAPTGMVVNLANWSDAGLTSLRPTSPSRRKSSSVLRASTD
jgi:hypothetical protein